VRLGGDSLLLREDSNEALAPDESDLRVLSGAHEDVLAGDLDAAQELPFPPIP